MPGERAVHCNAQSALEAILYPLFQFPWEEGDSVLDTSTAGSMNSSRGTLQQAPWCLQDFSCRPFYIQEKQ